MDARFGNIILIDGFCLFDPQVLPEYQEKIFLDRVHPDWASMGTDNPSYRGIVFPQIFQYPDTALTLGKRLIRVAIKTEIKLIFPR